MSTERFSGAGWFSLGTNITIIGCGSIGNTLAVNLLMHGHKVTVYDHDTVGEENVFVQGFTRDHIGMAKVDAMHDIYMSMVEDPFKEYDEPNAILIPEAWDNHDIDDIVIMAVDSIDVRKQIYEYLVANKESFMFIDARVAAEQFEIYNVVKSKIASNDHLYPATLFSADEAAPVNCTYKMTRHVAQICQGYMVSMLNNHLLNIKYGEEVYPYVFGKGFNTIDL